VHTLVQHLVRLKTTGQLSCFSLCYMSPRVFIQFFLKTEDNTLVSGSRSFNEDTKFSSEEDLLTELWSTDDLVELQVKSMG
jgi:hypothetical protein